MMNNFLIYRSYIPFGIRDVLFEFHLKFWNTTSFGIFQLEVYYKVYRLLSGLTAQNAATSPPNKTMTLYPQLAVQRITYFPRNTRTELLSRQLV